MSLFIIVWLVVFFLAKATFLVKDNQRLVVLRLGKFERVIGPGISLAMPFVDFAVVVELDKHLPEWQKFTEEERCAKVADMVKRNPDPKAFK